MKSRRHADVGGFLLLRPFVQTTVRASCWARSRRIWRRSFLTCQRARTVRL